MPPTEDEIRKMAKARVEFRRHAVAYALVNPFLAGVWYFTDADGFYWPLWVHLGWGLGLAFGAYHAYGSGGVSAIAREEEKLREKFGMK